MVDTADWQLKLGILGWSRAELADRLGVHASTVSRWGESCPVYAHRFLSAYEVLLVSGEAMVGLARMAKRGERGRGDSQAKAEWRERRRREASAEGRRVVSEDGYMRDLEGWEASDMDQDDGGYNRG